jgi:FkbH-like protein
MSNQIFAELSWLRHPPADFEARCRAAAKLVNGGGKELKALASYALDDNQLLKVARALRKLSETPHGLAPLFSYKLGLITNSTADFIAEAIAGTAPRFGMAVKCITGAYDQGLQESMDAHSAINLAQPNAVLIAIDWRGLPLRSIRAAATNTQELIDASLQYLNQIRSGIKQHSDAVCIVQNLAPRPERVYGSLDSAAHGALQHSLLEVNAAIARELQESSDVLFDAAGLAQTIGLADWHSPGEWNLAKLPFSQRLLPLYADHVCRLLAAMCGRSRRCLVLDLDNTLWGGVIGDDGLAGIQLAQGDATGEAFLDFQRYALDLRERGIVLAVSSKNNDDVARAPFRKHPEMLIREEHIAVFQANWNDKATNIQAIARELNLGLESLVFVDDNPVERDLVRTMLPEVAVPEMPIDPALYSRYLSASGYFESAKISAEDRDRAKFYEGNSKRAALQQQAGDIDQYLESLNMEIVFQPFDELGRTRISQLIMKSNQYNLTTRRYSEADVSRMSEDANYFTLQVRLIDAFGDNGMISVVICRDCGNFEWEIDTWLMSCRVLGRKVENMVLRELINHASMRQINRLRGIFIPSERNKLVEDHYEKLGFSLIGQMDDGSSHWLMECANAIIAEAPMRVRRIGFESL